MIQAADLFCGAGGSTTGLLRSADVLGVNVSMLAVNHWDRAIESHFANHPGVRHLCESLDSVDPRKVIPGGKLDVLTASPECTHHSIARGGMPCADQSRASAWHVARWAEAVRPEYIVVENVREFRDWGPLNKAGRPIKSKKGQTFAAFLRVIESLGYHVDHRVLNAADYGDATTRQRLFIQAWRKGKPTWPLRSHEGQWKPAKEVIDWELKGESIFGRKRPLSANTMRRIMAGLRKFSGVPFTFPVTHTHGGDRVRSAGEPLPTITTARRGEMALATPFVVELRGTAEGQIEESAHSIDSPLSTITTSGAHHALCEAFLLGQQSCAAARSVSHPMPTIATAGAIALAVPFVTKFNGTGGAKDVEQPLDTITTKDRFGLCLPVVDIEGQTFRLDVLFRMLQPHELKAAMGFPAEYRFAGNKGEQVKQIGNAVPVGTAEALFQNIFRRAKYGCKR